MEELGITTGSVREGEVVCSTDMAPMVVCAICPFLLGVASISPLGCRLDRDIPLQPLGDLLALAVRLLRPVTPAPNQLHGARFSQPVLTAR